MKIIRHNFTCTSVATLEYIKIRAYSNSQSICKTRIFKAEWGNWPMLERIIWRWKLCFKGGVNTKDPTTKICQRVFSISSGNAVAFRYPCTNFVNLFISPIEEIFKCPSMEYTFVKTVGAETNTLMSISDGLGPSIFCRKMEKTHPMRKKMDGKIVYFPPESAFLTLMLYFRKYFSLFAPGLGVYVK